MSGYVVKAAGTDRVVEMDWGRGFLDPGEALLDDLGWSVVPCPEGEDAVRIASTAVDGVRGRATLRGGLADRFYMVSSRVRTSTGRVLERLIVLRIAPGVAPDLRSSR